MKLIEVREGFCRIELCVQSNMLNGFGIAHGGISYCLADSALAFASNTKGRKSVSIETSISHMVSLHQGEVITAIAECEAESEKLGHYKVDVFIDGLSPKKIALFRGTVYKTSKMWEPY